MPRRHVTPLELADARREGFHEIGAAAAASGVSVKMIRHYEKIGLIPPATRTFANYRVYSDADVHSLCFIRRARDLGFGIRQIDALLALWRDRDRASAYVKRLALGHADEIERRIGELEAMRDTLRELAERCHGDARPECPILSDLSRQRTTQ